MARHTYPKNPVKVQTPPGPGSYQLKDGKFKRLDKPQKPPVAKSDRPAPQQPAATPAGKSGASNVAPLKRDKNKE